MNEEKKEVFFDLLTKKALYGLDADEQRELEGIDPGTAETELRSLELTAAAIDVAALPEIEPLPQHLRARILASSYDHVGLHTLHSAPRPVVETSSDSGGSFRSWFGWLGWIAATAACVALAANILFTRYPASGGPQAAVTPVPAATPNQATPAEQRQQFIATTPTLVRANWAPGNMRELKQVTGDVVWSDEKQTGYLRLRGLPINDPTTTCYQLWIFDEVQDKATPIDGGIFEVALDGEVIIPIDAKLRAVRPEMFAVTLERHGGVVVSKREKIAALAKVETQGV
jgi:hypothetical protein